MYGLRFCSMKQQHQNMPPYMLHAQRQYAQWSYFCSVQCLCSAWWHLVCTNHVQPLRKCQDFSFSWETWQWHSWRSWLSTSSQLMFSTSSLCTRRLEHQPSPTMPRSTLWILTLLCSRGSLGLWVPQWSVTAKGSIIENKHQVCRMPAGNCENEQRCSSQTKNSSLFRFSNILWLCGSDAGASCSRTFIRSLEFQSFKNIDMEMCRNV